MEEKDLDSFQQIFEQIKQNLEAIREQSSELTAVIGSDRLIPDETVERFHGLLQEYQERLALLRQSGEILSIPVNGRLADISVSLKAAEESVRLATRRSAVMDFFRLATKETGIQAELDAAKGLLMKQCREGDNLEPFLLVVQRAESSGEPMTYQEVSQISSIIGAVIPFALERRQLYIDRDAPVGQYMDGSCPLLSTEVGPPQSKSGPAISRAEDAAASGARREPAAAPKPAPGPIPQNTAAPASVVLLPEYSGYTDAVKVTFTDEPANQLKASKFVNMAKQKPGSVEALFLLAHQILLEKDDIADVENHYDAPSEELRGYLTRQGYMMELAVETAGKTRTFLTLTSKGWACFKKAETARYLSGRNRMVPAALRLTVAELTPKNVMRLVLLHDYYSRLSPKLNYAILPYSDVRLLIAGNICNDGEVRHKTVAAVFDAGDEERDICALQQLLGEMPAEDMLRVIVRSKADIPTLDSRLEYSSEKEDRVRYCVHGEPKVFWTTVAAP